MLYKPQTPEELEILHFDARVGDAIGGHSVPDLVANSPRLSPWSGDWRDMIYYTTAKVVVAHSDCDQCARAVARARRDIETWFIDNEDPAMWAHGTQLLASLPLRSMLAEGR
jgi:hypothetical protein